MDDYLVFFSRDIDKILIYLSLTALIITLPFILKRIANLIPFSRFDWFLAKSYFGSAKNKGFISLISTISIIGMFLGSASVVIAASFMNGMQAEVTKRVIATDSHLKVRAFMGRYLEYNSELSHVLGAVKRWIISTNDKDESMQRNSIDRMALAFTLAGLLALTGCHKKNRHDMAQDDQLQFTEEDMQQQSLVGYEDQDPSALPAADPMPQTVPETPVVPTQTLYAIQRGDTLWSIAKHHYGNGQRWKEIVAANPGLDPTKLKIGQQIIIP